MAQPGDRLLPHRDRHRRAAVCNLDIGEVDFDKKSVTVREKGGQTHRYKISKEGAKAIKDYLCEERGGDSELFPHSPALFLPPPAMRTAAAA